MRRAALAFLVLLTGCTPQSLFYYPNRKLYANPEAFRISYDILQYPSLNGKKLSSILMRTDQPPKGTVVHFHGNFGNLSNHFPLSIFLVKRGFDVLIFDYQGYGASEGHPTPRNTMEDGIATVRYAQAHLRNPQTGVVVLGQSLGGATAVVVASKEPMVKAAVIEAAFGSYSKMGTEVLQRRFWTWPFSFISFLFIGRTYDPLRYVADVSPRPVYFIHGDRDRTVPVHMSRDLYARAREPKTLWIVEGADHLECRTKGGTKYADSIVDFFTLALSTSTSTH